MFEMNDIAHAVDSEIDDYSNYSHAHVSSTSLVRQSHRMATTLACTGGTRISREHVWIRRLIWHREGWVLMQKFYIEHFNLDRDLCVSVTIDCAHCSNVCRIISTRLFSSWAKNDERISL